MRKNPQVKRIIWYQNIGFLSLILLFIFDEIVNFAAHGNFSRPFELLLQRSTWEIVVTLLVWYLVHTSTRRILSHLHYLENFLRVCAWCRRINFKGEWMRLEEFMQQGFDTPTTHGICMECFRKQQAAAEAAKAGRQRKKIVK